jgi:hypothetical protein
MHNRSDQSERYQTANGVKKREFLPARIAKRLAGGLYLLDSRDNLIPLCGSLRRPCVVEFCSSAVLHRYFAHVRDGTLRHPDRL